ncbi:hypothetical protein U1Q18_014186 [Sarracenia purpurea var. burkii]
MFSSSGSVQCKTCFSSSSSISGTTGKPIHFRKFGLLTPVNCFCWELRSIDLKVVWLPDSWIRRRGSSTAQAKLFKISSNHSLLYGSFLFFLCVLKEMKQLDDIYIVSHIHV